MVHFKCICSCDKAKLFEGRIFSHGSYEERTQWDGGFNVHIQGEEAYISLLDKGWNIKTHRETARFCKKQGAKRMEWEHKGKDNGHKV